ncbi:Nmad3 family putative nucleotide modification protein [Pseudomonas hormoni]
MLTAPDAANQTQWRMPSWFFPREGISRLSFNADLNRWTPDGEFCLLKSAARGQECLTPEKVRSPSLGSRGWLKSLNISEAAQGTLVPDPSLGLLVTLMFLLG